MEDPRGLSPASRGAAVVHSVKSRVHHLLGARPHTVLVVLVSPNRTSPAQPLDAIAEFAAAVRAARCVYLGPMPPAGVAPAGAIPTIVLPPLPVKTTIVGDGVAQTALEQYEHTQLGAISRAMRAEHTLHCAVLCVNFAPTFTKKTGGLSKSADLTVGDAYEQLVRRIRDLVVSEGSRPGQRLDVAAGVDVFVTGAAADKKALLQKPEPYLRLHVVSHALIMAALRSASRHAAGQFMLSVPPRSVASVTAGPQHHAQHAVFIDNDADSQRLRFYVQTGHCVVDKTTGALTFCGAPKRVRKENAGDGESAQKKRARKADAPNKAAPVKRRVDAEGDGRAKNKQVKLSPDHEDYSDEIDSDEEELTKTFEINENDKQDAEVVGLSAVLKNMENADASESERLFREYLDSWGLGYSGAKYYAASPMVEWDLANLSLSPLSATLDKLKAWRESLRLVHYSVALMVMASLWAAQHPPAALNSEKPADQKKNKTWEQNVENACHLALGVLMKYQHSLVALHEAACALEKIARNRGEATDENLFVFASNDAYLAVLRRLTLKNANGADIPSQQAALDKFVVDAPDAFIHQFYTELFLDMRLSARSVCNALHEYLFKNGQGLVFAADARRVLAPQSPVNAPLDVAIMLPFLLPVYTSQQFDAEMLPWFAVPGEKDETHVNLEKTVAENFMRKEFERPAFGSGAGWATSRLLKILLDPPKGEDWKFPTNALKKSYLKILEGKKYTLREKPENEKVSVEILSVPRNVSELVSQAISTRKAWTAFQTWKHFGDLLSTWSASLKVIKEIGRLARHQNLEDYNKLVSFQTSNAPERALAQRVRAHIAQEIKNQREVILQASHVAYYWHFFLRPIIFLIARFLFETWKNLDTLADVHEEDRQNVEAFYRKAYYIQPNDNNTLGVMPLVDPQDSRYMDCYLRDLIGFNAPSQSLERIGSSDVLLEALGMPIISVRDLATELARRVYGPYAARFECSKIIHKNVAKGTFAMSSLFGVRLPNLAPRNVRAAVWRELGEFCSAFDATDFASWLQLGDHSTTVQALKSRDVYPFVFKDTHFNPDELPKSDALHTAFGGTKDRDMAVKRCQQLRQLAVARSVFDDMQDYKDLFWPEGDAGATLQHIESNFVRGARTYEKFITDEYFALNVKVLAPLAEALAVPRDLNGVMTYGVPMLNIKAHERGAGAPADVFLPLGNGIQLGVSSAELAVFHEKYATFGAPEFNEERYYDAFEDITTELSVDIRGENLSDHVLKSLGTVKYTVDFEQLQHLASPKMCALRPKKESLSDEYEMLQKAHMTPDIFRASLHEHLSVPNQATDQPSLEQIAYTERFKFSDWDFTLLLQTLVRAGFLTRESYVDFLRQLVFYFYDDNKAKVQSVRRAVDLYVHNSVRATLAKKLNSPVNVAQAATTSDQITKWVNTVVEVGVKKDAPAQNTQPRPDSEDDADEKECLRILDMLDYYDFAITDVALHLYFGRTLYDSALIFGIHTSGEEGDKIAMDGRGAVKDAKKFATLVSYEFGQCGKRLSKDLEKREKDYAKQLAALEKESPTPEQALVQNNGESAAGASTEVKVQKGAKNPSSGRSRVKETQRELTSAELRRVRQDFYKHAETVDAYKEKVASLDEARNVVELQELEPASFRSYSEHVRDLCTDLEGKITLLWPAKHDIDLRMFAALDYTSCLVDVLSMHVRAGLNYVHNHEIIRREKNFLAQARDTNTTIILRVIDSVNEHAETLLAAITDPVQHRNRLQKPKAETPAANNNTGQASADAGSAGDEEQDKETRKQAARQKRQEERERREAEKTAAMDLVGEVSDVLDVFVRLRRLKMNFGNYLEKLADDADSDTAVNANARAATWRAKNITDLWRLWGRIYDYVTSFYGTAARLDDAQVHVQRELVGLTSRVVLQILDDAWLDLCKSYSEGYSDVVADNTEGASPTTIAEVLGGFIARFAAACPLPARGKKASDHQYTTRQRTGKNPAYDNVDTYDAFLKIAHNDIAHCMQDGYESVMNVLANVSAVTRRQLDITRTSSVSPSPRKARAALAKMRKSYLKLDVWSCFNEKVTEKNKDSYQISVVKVFCMYLSRLRYDGVAPLSAGDAKARVLFTLAHSRQCREHVESINAAIEKHNEAVQIASRSIRAIDETPAGAASAAGDDMPTERDYELREELAEEELDAADQIGNHVKYEESDEDDDNDDAEDGDAAGEAEDGDAAGQKAPFEFRDDDSVHTDETDDSLFTNDEASYNPSEDDDEHENDDENEDEDNAGKGGASSAASKNKDTKAGDATDEEDKSDDEDHEDDEDDEEDGSEDDEDDSEEEEGGDEEEEEEEEEEEDE